METRKIEITLEEARKWYNDSDKRLVHIALRAFKREELEASYYENIKTFEQALYALYPINNNMRESIISEVDNLNTISKASAARLKLKIIRQALNYNEGLSFYHNEAMSDNAMFYPRIVLVRTDCEYYYRPDYDNNNWKQTATIKIEDIKYDILGRVEDSCIGGLSGARKSTEVIHILPGLGLCGCARRYITEHFIKYFSTLMLVAIYGDDMPSFQVLNK